MLPASYQLPAAIVLLLGGTVACFFGYRMFRLVLAIAGFILGAAIASSVFGASDTGPMVIAATVGSWAPGYSSPRTSSASPFLAPDWACSSSIWRFRQAAVNHISW